MSNLEYTNESTRTRKNPIIGNGKLGNYRIEMNFGFMNDSPPNSGEFLPNSTKFVFMGCAVYLSFAGSCNASCHFFGDINLLGTTKLILQHKI